MTLVKTKILLLCQSFSQHENHFGKVDKISRIKKILSIGIIVFNFSDAVKVQDFDSVLF